MPSSISSSDPARSDIGRAWRRLFLAIVSVAGGALLAVFLFIAIVDPFESLPLAPPLPRVPVATNQRFAYPALARSPAFDSAVIGTSTSRLLRPSVLDAGLGGRFANLAMNAATAYEQARLMDVFSRAHPAARWVVLGIDRAVCITDADPPRYTDRPFPEYLYGRNMWAGYAHLLNMYAIEQAANQFAVVTGMKRPSHGLDGYTQFVPDDTAYDLARARAHIAEMERSDGPPDQTTVAPHLHGVDTIAAAIGRLPATARLLMFFAPLHIGLQPPSGIVRVASEACKARIAAIAAGRPNTIAADFLVPSEITTRDENYWDGLHTRVAVAARLTADLIGIAHGVAPTDGRVLADSRAGAVALGAADAGVTE